MVLTEKPLDFVNLHCIKVYKLKIVMHHMASVVVNYLSTVESNSNAENNEENDEFS